MFSVGKFLRQGAMPRSCANVLGLVERNIESHRIACEFDLYIDYIDIYIYLYIYILIIYIYIDYIYIYIDYIYIDDIVPDYSSIV